jgi:hypothetical protein
MNIDNMTLAELIRYADLPAQVATELDRVHTLSSDHEKEVAGLVSQIELLHEQLYFAAQTVNNFEVILKLGDTPSAKIKLLRAELSACSLER